MYLLYYHFIKINVLFYKFIYHISKAVLLYFFKIYIFKLYLFTEKALFIINQNAFVHHY